MKKTGLGSPANAVTAGPESLRHIINGSALATTRTNPKIFPFDVRCSMFDVRCSPFPRKNEKSPPDLSVKQGQIGGWEFAMLSFRAGYSARAFFEAAASFPTLF